MTREALGKLLEYLLSCYPNTKITDPKKMLDIWEMEFGSENAERVFSAARLHMASSKWMPKPSEIKEKLILIPKNPIQNQPLLEDSEEIRMGDQIVRAIIEDFQKELEEDCGACPFNNTEDCRQYRSCVHNI